MNNMAFMYSMGEGVVQSNVEAYAWFALAASREHGQRQLDLRPSHARQTPVWIG